MTVAARREDVIGLCTSFGFRIEGAAHRRYADSSTELVLTKHLLFETVNSETVEGWWAALASSVFSIDPVSESSGAPAWFQPPQAPEREGAWDHARQKATLTNGANSGSTEFSVGKLEEIFYPLRLAIAGRSAYVVPIQPQWADRMMESPRRQEALFRIADKLMLRIDNAYYCSPVYADDDIAGSPIIFYVSSPESALTGVARVINREIAVPEDLYLRYGQMGIYGLNQIRGHVAKKGQHQGAAMAMHFGWWVPFASPIALDDAKTAGLLNGHPQRMLKISYAAFEKALAKGGLVW